MIAVRIIVTMLVAVFVLPVAAAETPVQVVTHLYRDFAWEAVIAEPLAADKSLVELPQSALQRYFDDNLSSLIVRDQECATKTHEICCLDFMPLWDSQDPAGATDLRITSSPQPGLVNVRFRYGKRVVALKFHLVTMLRGWRVADIEYPSEPSLLHQLKCK